MKSLWCSIVGHKKLVLDVLDHHPLINIGDQSGNLVDVDMCARCHLLYWEVTNAVNEKGLRPTAQNDSVCWN